jgi:uncharacterized protein
MDGSTSPKAGPRCPVCRKPTLEAVKPFCSARCADVDLGRWLTGGYAISGGTDDADEDGDGAGPPPTNGDEEPGDG